MWVDKSGRRCVQPPVWTLASGERRVACGYMYMLQPDPHVYWYEGRVASRWEKLDTDEEVV